MRKLLSIFGVVAVLAASSYWVHTLDSGKSSKAHASSSGWKGQKFVKQFFFYGAAGKGSRTGLDAGNAMSIADGDIWAIPAGTVIEKVYMIVTAAITGTTVLTVGDDDGATSFIPAAAITLGTPGLYGWDAKNAGAYLRVETAGASDAADIYVVPQAKYYSAAGKEVKLDNTTTNTGGAFSVVIEGMYLK